VGKDLWAPLSFSEVETDSRVGEGRSNERKRKRLAEGDVSES